MLKNPFHNENFFTSFFSQSNWFSLETGGIEILYFIACSRNTEAFALTYQSILTCCYQWLHVCEKSEIRWASVEWNWFKLGFWAHFSKDFCNFEIIFWWKKNQIFWRYSFESKEALRGFNPVEIVPSSQISLKDIILWPRSNFSLFSWILILQSSKLVKSS